MTEQTYNEPIVFDKSSNFLGVKLEPFFSEVPSRTEFVKYIVKWEEISPVTNLPQIMVKNFKKDRTEALMMFIHCRDNDVPVQFLEQSSVKVMASEGQQTTITNRLIEEFFPDENKNLGRSLLEWGV